MLQIRVLDAGRLVLLLLSLALLLARQPGAYEAVVMAPLPMLQAPATDRLLAAAAGAGADVAALPCTPSEPPEANRDDEPGADSADSSESTDALPAAVSAAPAVRIGSDPLHTYNENLWRAIHAPQRAPRVHVAILDGPVRDDHPDLPPVVHIAPRLRLADGSCGGEDCCPRVAPAAPSWHATRVAGLIAAVRENGIGLAGLAEVGELVSIDTRIDGAGGDLRLAAALRCAIDYRGADGAPLRVVNMSLGTQATPRSNALREALQAASDAGLLLVASAGNSGADIARLPRWPASFNAETMLTVEARRYDGALSKNSNSGFGTVDIGAPAPEPDEGPPVCTTSVAVARAASGGCAGDYAHFDRTSAAAAIVSGAAALVWRDPRYADCSAVQLRQLLLQNGRHCRYGADPGQPPICMLDLAFLGDPASAAAGLCARRGSD